MGLRVLGLGLGFRVLKRKLPGPPSKDISTLNPEVNHKSLNQSIGGTRQLGAGKPRGWLGVADVQSLEI